MRAFTTSISDNAPVAAPGVVILDANDRLDSVTPAGQQLIELLPSPPGLPTPGILHGLALLARAPHGPETVHARVPGRDGRWLYVERIQVSPWTVQDHLKAVFAKVGVRSRQDLAVRLFEAPAHRSPK